MTKDKESSAFMQVQWLCRIGDFSLIWVIPLAHVLQTMSAWLCAAIAIDRYMAIVHPLRSLNYLGLRCERILLQ